MPPGTLRLKPGLPAAVAIRGITTFAYFGTDASVSLTLASLHGTGLVLAGLPLTAAALTWTAGAWVQERAVRRVGPRAFVRTGRLIIAAGIGGMIVVAHFAVPVVVAFVAWGVAGFGMGMSYAPVSLVVLAERRGRRRHGERVAAVVRRARRRARTGVSGAIWRRARRGMGGVGRARCSRSSCAPPSQSARRWPQYDSPRTSPSTLPECRRRGPTLRPTTRAIAVGGAFGTPRATNSRSRCTTPSNGIPWATFSTNKPARSRSGCSTTIVGAHTSRHGRPFVAVGFLGAFTTFSTLAIETVLLVKNHHAGVGNCTVEQRRARSRSRFARHGGVTRRHRAGSRT